MEQVRIHDDVRLYDLGELEAYLIELIYNIGVGMGVMLNMTLVD
jgi:hypothetical protein